MKKLILILIFPVFVFSQGSNAHLFRLLSFSGFKQNKASINFSENLEGSTVYDKDTIQSVFSIKNSVLKDSINLIKLSDKKLLKLNLISNLKKIDFERIPFDDKLKRKIIDTLDVKVYDNHLDYDIADVKFYGLIFKYNGQFFKIKNGIFRNREKNLLKTLNSINIPENTKTYLLSYFIK